MTRSHPTLKSVNRRGVLQRLTGSICLLSVPAILPATGAVAATPATHRIDIRQFVYRPAVVQVRPGDKIVWTNHDIVPHTATADDYSWDTGKLEKGESAELIVTDDFFADYFCIFHPNMKAQLVLPSG